MRDEPSRGGGAPLMYARDLEANPGLAIGAACRICIMYRRVHAIFSQGAAGCAGPLRPGG
jgi:hypothetical protein